MDTDSHGTERGSGCGVVVMVVMVVVWGGGAGCKEGWFEWVDVEVVTNVGRGGGRLLEVGENVTLIGGNVSCVSQLGGWGVEGGGRGEEVGKGGDWGREGKGGEGRGGGSVQRLRTATLNACHMNRNVDQPHSGAGQINSND